MVLEAKWVASHWSLKENPQRLRVCSKLGRNLYYRLLAGGRNGGNSLGSALVRQIPAAGHTLLSSSEPAPLEVVPWPGRRKRKEPCIAERIALFSFCRSKDGGSMRA